MTYAAKSQVQPITRNQGGIMGAQSTGQKIMFWLLNVAVSGLIALNVWMVRTILEHDKVIAVQGTGLQARLEAIAVEQARLARAQEESAKQLKEINETMLRHISKAEAGGEQYGNQVKGKAGIQ
jgi:hypothetical protein